jgi:ankyrin repeat protein
METITTATTVESAKTRWDIEKEFYDACHHGNIKKMTQWIQDHPQLVEVPKDKKRLVYHCALNNKIQSLEHLLIIGFLGEDPKDSSLIVKCATFGCAKSIRALLKLGFNPNTTTEDGGKALDRAASGGHYNATKTLLKVGVKPDLQTHRELLGASLNQKNETLRLLLEQYPKEIIQSLKEGTLNPAQSSDLPAVKQRALSARKKADELSKSIAETLIKEREKENLSILLKRKDNTLEI